MWISSNSNWNCVLPQPGNCHFHDDIKTWTRFPFVWGHLWMDSPHKGPVIWTFDNCIVVSLNELLNNQSCNDLRCHDVHVMSPWGWWLSAIYGIVQKYHDHGTYALSHILYWAINLTVTWHEHCGISNHQCVSKISVSGMEICQFYTKP